MTVTSKKYLAIAAVVYFIVLVTLVGGMYFMRQSVLRTLSTPEARGDWQQWRSDVEQQQEEPLAVARRVPKSEEPPALILMRDYFVTCLIGATLFVSLLYWAFAGMVIGALAADRATSTSQNNRPS